MPTYRITISNISAYSELEALEKMKSKNNGLIYTITKSDGAFIEWFKDNGWMISTILLIVYIIWIG